LAIGVWSLSSPVTLAWLVLTSFDAVLADESPKFELRDGDRVVFVGSTFIERDQTHGYLETLLTSRYPDRHVTFRNLGWSGDTVFGEARARFGSPADGFQHLREHVEALKPTVLFVCYGMNESFEGSAGLERFNEGLKKLLDVLATTKARVVLISPNRHEDLGRPFPDPTAHNQYLKLYSDALRQSAMDRGYGFVDLFDLLGDGTRDNPPRPLTDNGIHLTSYGYWRAAAAIERGLGFDAPKWLIEFGDDGRPAKWQGTTVSDVAREGDAVRFSASDDRLPGPIGPIGSRRSVVMHPRTIRIRGLKRGDYALKIDGQPAADVRIDDEPTNVQLTAGSDLDQVQELRSAILAKNQLYFHRWRPQNETYLFGFRKHEQGNNAAEVPKFDPLVEELEAKIANLRVPQQHIYEVVPSKEPKE
jgi:lysophospholipase L1-like esterase